jgi:hypothetical protein
VIALKQSISGKGSFRARDTLKQRRCWGISLERSFLSSWQHQSFSYSRCKRARDESTTSAHPEPVVVVVICPKTRALFCVGYIVALPSCRRKEEDEESLLLHLGVKCFSLIFTSTGSLGSLVTHTRAHRDYIKADFTRDFAFSLSFRPCSSSSGAGCVRVYIG